MTNFGTSRGVTLCGRIYRWVCKHLWCSTNNCCVSETIQCRDNRTLIGSHMYHDLSNHVIAVTVIRGYSLIREPSSKVIFILWLTRGAVNADNYNNDDKHYDVGDFETCSNRIGKVTCILVYLYMSALLFLGYICTLWDNKKSTILSSTPIISRNVDQFSKFFHWHSLVYT